MNFSIFNSELSASISNAFLIWLALSVKATLIAGALLAICSIRNKWRPDHGMTLLWKSSFLALALAPVLALTPGIKWSIGEFDSAILINTSIWKTWTNSGLTGAELDHQAQQNSYNSATGSVDPSKAETLTVSMGNSAESDSSSKPSWLLPFQWLVVSVWGLVAVFIATCKFWAFTIGTQRWFKHLKTSQAPDEWTQELAIIRQRLHVHRPVDLLISSQLISPVAIGVRRPRIVLPEEALSWSTEERQSAIAHELCHIRNRDPEFQWLTAWVQSCFWFHPWIHRMTHWMTLDQERDGDQAALQSGATKDIYLNFLTHVASQVRSGKASISPKVRLLQTTGSGIQMASGNESSLKLRILAISRFSASRPAQSWIYRFVAAGTLFLLGCGIGSAQLTSSIKGQNTNTNVLSSAPSNTDSQRLEAKTSIPAKSEQPPVQPSQEQVHAKFTILEMDESKAKEFIEQWFEGDQIRSEFDYQISDSIGLEEALKNLDTNISPSKPNPIVHKTAETNSSEEVSTSTAEDTPKLQFILPDPTFRNVMKWVKDQQIEVLSAPQVTTLSGRQAQIAVTQEISIVSGLETSEGKTNYTTQQVPYGLSIDMVPVVKPPFGVESPKPTIDLTLVVQFSEFLGYDDPTEISKAVLSDSDKAAKFQIPLPRSRKRTLTTKVEVPDGAALLIGSLPATNSILFKSKVPMLGDLPFVGKLFRHEGSQEVRKMRFIIVQPTIMDSGNQ